MSQEQPWTVGRLLTWTTDFFASQSADNEGDGTTSDGGSRLDAEVLLAHVRGCQRIELYTVFDEPTPDDLRERFKALVKRRAAGEPVAYLVGEKEFYSLTFEVTRDTLIPRSETESIVVRLTDLVKENPRPDETLKICDVGTGSGILAICAAKYVANANVLATDLSVAALAVARRNAERHGVAERTFFVEADLFPANKPDMGLDYIVSNPPYVTSAEMTELPTSVADFEPHSALDGGAEGVEVIGRLLPAAARQLKPGGVLLMEISPMIADRVEQLVRDTQHLTPRPTIRDLADHKRIVEAIKT